MRTMDNFKQQNSNNNKVHWSAQALRNTTRQRIFELLSERNNCSFNELLSYLNIPRQKLAYHLQILTKYNILSNFYDKREGVKDHSFYELSGFGRELISGMTSSNQNIPMSQLKENNTQLLTRGSANFRTIRRVEYKSYTNMVLKQTKNSILPIATNDQKFIDPLIRCVIKNKNTKEKNPKKVYLPSLKKYYSSYKHPFKLEHDIESQE